MVVNLCLPHFRTTAECNKLCADGYDVTNLLSADPAVRRRGFKLEYFLRPPVQVTLQFDVQVEVCRVDVELWPWAMDRGQACMKKVEISTSSERDGGRAGGRGQDRKPSDPSSESDGPPWSSRARQRGGRSSGEPQRASGDDTSRPEPEFKLVGRCELRDDTLVCFSHPCFHPRPPFPTMPPPAPTACRREALWSRGPLSLGSVSRLRVAVPFGGGGGSALGLKALAVWGQPARCCPAVEVERVRTAHQASRQRRPTPPPGFLVPSADQTLSAEEMTASLPSVPEEFLDPITQEVMVLPMLLPGGTSVDHSTLEEFRRREATWGRAPNDPFTGVPFTAASQPLPNPLLKSRIDRFVLRSGTGLREGALGRLGEGEKPQASRLLDPKRDESRGFAGSSAAAATDHDPARRLDGNKDTEGGRGEREKTLFSRLSIPTLGSGARGSAGSGPSTDKHLARGSAGSEASTDKHLARVSAGSGASTDKHLARGSAGSGPSTDKHLARGSARSEASTDKHLARGSARSGATTDKHLARGSARSGATTDKHLARGSARSGASTDKHLARALNGGDDRKPRRPNHLGDSRQSVQPESAPDCSAHHDGQQLPEPKRPRMDTDSAPGSVCHEQRLSTSLDEALFSALQGRPSFTSRSTSNRHSSSTASTTTTTDTSPQDASQHRHIITDTPGENRCCSCSCSLSSYTTRAAVYRLPCDHLLCRPCLHAVAPPASNRVQCPACRTCAARGDIARVHH